MEASDRAVVDGLRRGDRAAFDAAYPLAAARIRARAQAVLARERAIRDAGPLRRAWERILEPALASAAIAAFLGWAIAAVRALP